MVDPMFDKVLIDLQDKAKQAKQIVEQLGKTYCENCGVETKGEWRKTCPKCDYQESLDIDRSRDD